MACSKVYQALSPIHIYCQPKKKHEGNVLNTSLKISPAVQSTIRLQGFNAWLPKCLCDLLSIPTASTSLQPLAPVNWVLFFSNLFLATSRLILSFLPSMVLSIVFWKHKPVCYSSAYTFDGSPFPSCKTVNQALLIWLLFTLLTSSFNHMVPQLCDLLSVSQPALHTQLLVHAASLPYLVINGQSFPN